MSDKDKELLQKITIGIQLAVKNELEKIRQSPYPTIAISRDGKTIEYINLKEQSTK